MNCTREEFNVCICHLALYKRLCQCCIRRVLCRDCLGHVVTCKVAHNSKRLYSKHVSLNYLLFFFRIILWNLSSFCFLNKQTPMSLKRVTEMSATTSLDTKKDSSIICVGKDLGGEYVLIGNLRTRRSSRRRRLLTGKGLERERQFRREKGNLRCSRSVGRRRRHWM